ncbi:hypothetical protein LIA77_02562 [Sarocladium implicatum]|nr:hypothetical protein LIA77_02562 [Sarocladium implicatum]
MPGSVIGEAGVNGPGATPSIQPSVRDSLDAEGRCKPRSRSRKSLTLKKEGMEHTGHMSLMKTHLIPSDDEGIAVAMAAVVLVVKEGAGVGFKLTSDERFQAAVWGWLLPTALLPGSSDHLPLLSAHMLMHTHKATAHQLASSRFGTAHVCCKSHGVVALVLPVLSLSQSSDLIVRTLTRQEANVSSAYDQSLEQGTNMAA